MEICFGKYRKEKKKKEEKEELTCAVGGLEAYPNRPTPSLPSRLGRRMPSPLFSVSLPRPRGPA
jgi:hypothetical protein